MNELIDGKRIAIIGAGPAGLALAVLLQQKGADIQVFESERSKSSRIWGGTLDLHDNMGLAVLKTAGLLDEFYAAARSVGERFYDSAAYLLRESSAAVSAGFPAATTAVMPHTVPLTGSLPETLTAVKHHRPEIDRACLNRILIKALKPDTIINNKKFTALKKQRHGYELIFEDDSSAGADIIIAADGSDSKLRHYVTDIKPVYSGTCIIQGEIFNPGYNCPQIYKLAGIFNLNATGGNKSIFVQKRGDGSFVYYLSCRQNHDSAIFNMQEPAAIVSFLKDLFIGWNQVFYELFTATKEFFIQPMFNLAVQSEHTEANEITLIGDAAHLMPPYAGYGVNLGFLDAQALAANLTGTDFATISEALRDYERQMVLYVAKAQAETSSRESDMHFSKEIVSVDQVFSTNYNNML